MTDAVTNTRIPGLRYLTYWPSPQRPQGAVITSQVPGHVAEALTRRTWNRRTLLVPPLTAHLWATPFLAAVTAFVVLAAALAPSGLTLPVVLAVAVGAAGVTYWAVDLYGQRRSDRQWQEYRNLLEHHWEHLLPTDDPVAQAAMRVLDAEREAREAVQGRPALVAEMPDVAVPIDTMVRRRMRDTADDLADAAELGQGAGEMLDDDDEPLRWGRLRVSQVTERWRRREESQQEMVHTLNELRMRLEQLSARSEGRRQT